MGGLSFDTQFLSSNLNGILKRVGKVKMIFTTRSLKGDKCEFLKFEKVQNKNVFRCPAVSKNG